MLSNLRIENIAVIACADIDFSNGFCVMTGETGAGKSVIVDSIMLVCGAKGDRELVRSGQSTALVSAHFCELSAPCMAALEQLGVTSDDGCVVLQRTLGADGKSTARINGRTVTLSMLREVGSRLISIHGQDDTRMLSDLRYHVDMLDAYAGLEAQREAYGEIYAEWSALCEKRAALVKDAGEKLRTVEMLTYQIKDIESLKLKECILGILTEK